MPRSASTWSYNVAAGLPGLAGPGEVVGAYDENLYPFLRGQPASAAHAAMDGHAHQAPGRGCTACGWEEGLYPTGVPAERARPPRVM